MPSRQPLFGVPLRFRLTAWYIALLALTLLAFCGYLYISLEQSLLAQLDAALAVAATQAPLAFDGAGPRFERSTDIARQLANAGFGLRLINDNGQMLDALGITDAPILPTLEAGYATLEGDAARWRIYAQPIVGVDGTMVAWLHVIQPLSPVQAALERLSAQMWFGFPLALILAAAGGWFLAQRALAPVDRMTSTAAALSASDLTHRIGYTGPADEIGRLATTFDAMLDRIAAAFTRERRFTADAAHELRTPLAALKGRIEVALHQPRSTEEYVTFLQALASDVDRLVRLSNDLLLLARLDDGELHTAKETLRFDELLASVIESVGDLAGARGIELRAGAMEPLLVTGDLSQLGRLFLNLLDNALKFTPAGGSATVCLYREGTWAVATVTDTGQGIAPEHLPFLGQRFYRGAADRARSTGGSGLGLAIAKEIVRAHGGTLAIDSVAGKGTTVTVRLPLFTTAPES